MAQLTFNKNRDNNKQKKFKEIKETHISEPQQTYQEPTTNSVIDNTQPQIKTNKLGRPRKNKKYSSIRLQTITIDKVNAMQNTLNFPTQDDLIDDLLEKRENGLSQDQRTMYKMYFKSKREKRKQIGK